MLTITKNLNYIVDIINHNFYFTGMHLPFPLLIMALSVFTSIRETPHHFLSYSEPEVTKMQLFTHS